MRRLGRFVVGAALVGATVFGGVVWAKKPGGGGGGGGGTGCPGGFECLDVWDPVVCADGITYSNQCYADRACAPGPCTPGGDVL